MKRVLLLLALVSCISMATRADVVTPGTQTLPVSTTATINVLIPASGPSFCIPIFPTDTCTESVVLTVTSGPDAGTTISTDVSLFFNLGDPIPVTDTLTNNGIAGTDVISTTEAGEVAQSFNNVDVVWTSSGPGGGGSVPEPSSIALLLGGLAAMGLTGLRVKREA